MPIEPHGSTIFCDDIRPEIGNKFSLMGIFQGDMVLHVPFPATLPKLGLFITYSEAMSDAPTNMALKVYFPNDPEDKPSFIVPVEWPEDASTQNPAPDTTIRQIKMQFVLSPVVLKEPGRIKVRMEKQGSIIKLGSLKLIAGQQSPTQE